MTVVYNTEDREIWGCHGLVYEDSGLLRCNAFSLVECFPTFRRITKSQRFFTLKDDFAHEM